MSYYRTKTIKGRTYLYRQTSVREGKKVRMISEYLGSIGLSVGGSAEQKKRREYQAHYDQAMRSLA
jgi:hypothetical protein